MKPNPHPYEDDDPTPTSNGTVGQLEALDRIMKAYQEKCFQMVRLEREMDQLISGPLSDAFALLSRARELLEDCEQGESWHWIQECNLLLSRYGEKEIHPQAQS